MAQVGDVRGADLLGVELAGVVVHVLPGVVVLALGAARKVSGWPKRCKLAREFLQDHNDTRPELARRLGQRGGLLTCPL